MEGIPRADGTDAIDKAFRLQLKHFVPLRVLRRFVLSIRNQHTNTVLPNWATKQKAVLEEEEEFGKYFCTSFWMIQKNIKGSNPNVKQLLPSGSSYLFHTL